MLAAVTSLPIVGASNLHTPDPCQVVVPTGELQIIDQVPSDLPPKECGPKPCDGQGGQLQQWTRGEKDDGCHDDKPACDDHAQVSTRSDKKDERCHDGGDKGCQRDCGQEGCKRDCEPTPPTDPTPPTEPPTPPTQVPFFPSATSLVLGALGAVASVIVAIRKKL